jgi:hypothetical protein
MSVASLIHFRQIVGSYFKLGHYGFLPALILPLSVLTFHQPSCNSTLVRHDVMLRESHKRECRVFINDVLSKRVKFCIWQSYS